MTYSIRIFLKEGIDKMRSKVYYNATKRQRRRRRRICGAFAVSFYKMKRRNCYEHGKRKIRQHGIR